jgi:hypothetical protein
MAKSSVGFASVFGVNSFVATSLTLVTLGCTRNSATNNPLAMDVGQKVIRRNDKNGDGLLTVSELSGLYGNRSSFREGYDLDGDEKLSRDEIASRIDSWQKEGPTRHVVDVTVTLDGSPLAGATVRMVPDFAPGDSSQVEVGQTDATGTAHMEVALEDLSQALRNPDYRGVFGSNYKIEVTHSQRKIPARNNVNSELRVDVPRDTARNEVRLDLDSRSGR